MAKQTTTKLTEAEVKAAAEEATAAFRANFPELFQTAADFGSQHAKGSDAESRFAIDIAEKIDAEQLPYEPQKTGRGAKPNLVKALVNAYETARGTAEKNFDPQFASKVQKIAEVANRFRTNPAFNEPFYKVLRSALERRAQLMAEAQSGSRKVRRGIKALYAIATEQNAADKNDPKKFAHTGPLSQEEIEELLYMPETEKNAFGVPDFIAELAGMLDKVLHGDKQGKGYKELRINPGDDYRDDLEEMLENVKRIGTEIADAAKIEKEEKENAQNVIREQEDINRMMELLGKKGFTISPPAEPKPAKNSKRTRQAA